MARTAERVELESDWGEPVVYTITPWGGIHAIRMLRKLGPILKRAVASADILIPMFTELRKGLAADAKEAATGDGEAAPKKEGADDVLLRIAGMAAPMLAPMLDEVFTLIAEHGDEQLFMDILIDTSRSVAGEGAIMGNRAEFNKAYSANMLELMAITVHVLRVNFGKAFSRGKRTAATSHVVTPHSRQR